MPAFVGILLLVGSTVFQILLFRWIAKDRAKTRAEVVELRNQVQNFNHWVGLLFGPQKEE